MEISFNGISCFIERDLYEPDDIFYKRLWFIIKQNPYSLKKLEEIILYSLYWKNIKYYNCKYNDDIQKIISKFDTF